MIERPPDYKLVAPTMLSNSKFVAKLSTIVFTEKEYESQLEFVVTTFKYSSIVYSLTSDIRELGVLRNLSLFFIRHQCVLDILENHANLNQQLKNQQTSMVYM